MVRTVSSYLVPRIGEPVNSCDISPQRIHLCKGFLLKMRFPECNLMYSVTLPGLHYIACQKSNPTTNTYGITLREIVGNLHATFSHLRFSTVGLPTTWWHFWLRLLHFSLEIQ